MPKVSKRRRNGVNAVNRRDSVENHAEEGATPRGGRRRTSTPLDDEVHEPHADMDMPMDSPIIDSDTPPQYDSDSAEASEDDGPIGIAACGPCRGARFGRCE